MEKKLLFFVIVGLPEEDMRKAHDIVFRIASRYLPSVFQPIVATSYQATEKQSIYVTGMEYPVNIDEIAGRIEILLPVDVIVHPE